MSHVVYRFACGTIVNRGDRLTHADYPGAVVIVNNVFGHDGPFTVIFSVELPDGRTSGGSCMSAGDYTRDEFVWGRVGWLRPTEPDAEPAVGEEVMW